MEKELHSDLSDRDLEKALIFEQTTRLKKRKPGKYDPILLAVKMSPTLEVCYHFGRAIDDIADGDTALPEGFSDITSYFTHLKSIVSQPLEINGKESPAEFLLKRSTVRLGEIAKPTDDIQGLIVDFLEGMSGEYKLRNERSILTKEQLTTLYKNSFEPPQDIALLAMRSSIRSRNIPELAQIQGKSYSISDMEVDLRNGVCRIPQEVLANSRLGRLVFENYDQVKNDPFVRTWINTEIQSAGKMKKNLLKRKMDIQARLLCKFMTFRVKTE